jgi:Na+/H+-dicarboxylate symporter
LDMMTTVINVTGCGCVTVLVDKSENTLNVDVYNHYPPRNSQKLKK